MSRRKSVNDNLYDMRWRVDVQLHTNGGSASSSQQPSAIIELDVKEVHAKH